MTVALVTGGAGGLGRVIASVLLDDGWDVAVIDRDEPTTLAAANELGERVFGVPADVTSETQVTAAVRAVEQRWGRIDALVNNAGIEPFHTIETVDTGTWQATLDANLRGPALLIKACAPVWRKQGGGRVVNIGSRTWLAGGPTAAYAASKAGLIGLTRSVATELGRFGVTANVVAPSFVHTPLNESMTLDPAGLEEFAERFAALSPLRRLIDPVDVAHAVAFLVSDRARNITGEVLHVAAG